MRGHVLWTLLVLFAPLSFATIGGGQGKADGQFMESNYMTWDNEGNIYLGDTILPRVTELLAPRK